MVLMEVSWNGRRIVGIVTITAHPLTNAWESGDGSYRVVRGGSGGSSTRDCRSAHRDLLGQAARCFHLSFRLLRIL